MPRWGHGRGRYGGIGGPGGGGVWIAVPVVE